MSGVLHVFSGPSIPKSVVRQLAPAARLHPPIAHGDLLRLGPDPGDVVVIIDGVFYQSAAIRHKELLLTLSRGVDIVGASSMGALRAAELRNHGMRGYGTVYDLYAAGELEADDEVAVAHADASEDFRALSVALVSLRVAGSAAAQAGEVDPGAVDLLISSVKARYFTERTLGAIRADAQGHGFSDHAVSMLLERLRRDIKWQDAEACLRQAGPGRPRDLIPDAIGHTHHLRRWQDRHEGRAPLLRETALGLLQLTWPGFPDVYEQVVRRQLAALWQCGTDDEALGREFAPRTGISEVTQEHREQWFADPRFRGGSDLAELAVLTYRHAPGLTPVAKVWEELRGTALLERAEDVAQAVIDFNAKLAERNGDHVPEMIPGHVSESWLAELWRTDRALQEGYRRGFRSRPHLLETARTFIAYDRTRSLDELVDERAQALGN